MTTTKTNKVLLTAAINLELIDTAALIKLVCAHESELAAMIDEIDGVAECLQHCDPVKRAAWIAVRDAARFFELDAKRGETADRFGFRAEARDAATAAFEAAGISA